MAFEEDSQTSFMTRGQKVAYSVVGGFVFTLATALLPNTALIGTSAHGYPFPWLSQPPLSPRESNDSFVDWSGFRHSRLDSCSFLGNHTLSSTQ